MSAQVTVVIPEPLFKRANALARARMRPIETVIAEALDLGLSSETAEVQEGESNSPFASAGEEGKRLAEETAAYEAMHGQLLTSHPGEHVAIYNGQLVDHDPDLLTLVSRIDALYPDEVVLIKQVMPLPERVLRVFSPRLERI
jgi:hypothetical protein